MSLNSKLPWCILQYDIMYGNLITSFLGAHLWGQEWNAYMIMMATMWLNVPAHEVLVLDELL